MCGIVGFYYRDPARPVERSTIERMCRAIIHRGPDDEGMLLDGNLGMGMRRLSIIDVAGGHQPVFNEDGQVAVVFNGEIFNYPELRTDLEQRGHRFQTRCDTEALAHGYETWGDELPRRLNGMFAYSIWDARRRRLLIARDHIGVKPLYVYEDEEKIAWASEIKALLAAPSIEAELDERGLLDFLTFGYVPAPGSMFRRIRKLPAATQMVIDGRGLREETYWDVAFGGEERDAASWCEELRSLLDDSVRRQLMSDVPLGAFLSGGIDSSAIVATMRRLGVGHIATYSIGFGKEDKFHNELDKARIVSRAMETDHHEIVVEPDATELMAPLIWHLDEPFTDTSFLVTYLVSKLARDTVTVILSGVGGDELFAGYRRYLGPQIERLYGWVPRGLHRRVIRPLVERLPVDRGSRCKALCRYARGFLSEMERPAAARYQGYVDIFDGAEHEGLLAADLAATRRQHAGEQVAQWYRTAPAHDALNRMLYADLKTSLSESLLAFTDKMSMAVSLEARVPLLDYRLVELAARIPPALKLAPWGGMKRIFKAAVSDRLPKTILHRKKQGFGAPVGRWFRSSLRPMIDELLSHERIAQRGYFRPEAVRRLVDDHANQRADYSEHLLALLTFEIWHQTFLDRKAA